MSTTNNPDDPGHERPDLTPEREDELAKALYRYTNPHHPEYDPVFSREIRRLRPDWFIEEN